MSKWLTTLKNTKIIPLISVNDVDQAKQMMQLLAEANILVAEIGFNQPNSSEILTALKNEFPEALFLAGGIIQQESAALAIESGADILITPSINPSILKFAQEKECPIIPGVNTPLSLEMALANNISLVKFFPAEASGGVKLIKALNSVYPDITYIPTGGIDDSNIDEYFTHKNVIACGIGFISETKQIQKGNWRLLKTRIKTIQSILKYT